MKLLPMLICVGVLVSCSSHPCKIEERTDIPAESMQKGSAVKKDLTTRVFVYKSDGSLQCGQGSKIDLNVMQKDLGNIEVFSAENKHDGMMRIQVCGHPTGYANVYEIDQKDFEAALKAGFKKWLK